MFRLPVIGPLIPSDEVLIGGAPFDIWQIARKEAERSPMQRFRVGSVIFNPRNGEIVSKGTSHIHIEQNSVVFSVHAELHALRRSYQKSLEGMHCVVYSMNKSGGCAWSSRPCFSCSTSLFNWDIERVIYPERDADNIWSVREEHPEELLARAIPISGGYAKGQRIP